MAINKSLLTMDDNHVYRYDGQVVMNVTTIIEDIDPLDNVPEDRLKKAGKRGDDVHWAIELYNEVGTVEIDEELRPYFDQYLEFKEIWNHKSLYNERMVYSEQYRYAGTVDSIGAINDNKMVLVDYKTASKVNYKKTGLQLAAYRQALKEEGIIVDGGVLLWLQDNKYKPLIYTSEQLDFHFENFIALLKAKKIIKFYGGK